MNNIDGSMLINGRNPDFIGIGLILSGSFYTSENKLCVMRLLNKEAELVSIL